MRLVGYRRHTHVSLAVSVTLVLLLGGLVLLAGRDQQHQALRAHRGDRQELQTLFAGLTDRFLLASAGDLDSHGGTGAAPWPATPGDPATVARLTALQPSVRSADRGLVLVDALGRTLGAVGSDLPAADDPGWTALRTAALAGRLPVSDLLSAATDPMIAIGVPTTLVGGAPALFLGLSAARTGGLQRYTEGLPHSATRHGWVLDGRGLVVAADSADAVGAPLPLRHAAARIAPSDPPVLVDTVEDGTDWVVSSAPAGTTGWRSMTTQTRESFQGATERSGRLVQLLLCALVVLAGTGLVVLSRKRESALRQIALYDDLTGVHNRRGWFTLAEEELRRAERSGAQRVLLFVDLDGLKQVNDVLGHREGDRAIVDAATVLRAASRSSDLVGRLGGDEFVLLLGDGADLETGRRRLLDALDAHNAASRAGFELRLSLGAEVWFPQQAGTLDDLVRRADARMYEHKRSRPDRSVGVLRVGDVPEDAAAR